MRERVPGYITKQVSNDFGLDVRVQRAPYPKADTPASGNPVPEGGTALDPPALPNTFRNVIPPGSIGSSETSDLNRLTLPQYMDTVEFSPGETRDPKLHGPMDALRVAGKQEIPFQNYGSFQPRRAPMPRTAGDEGFLEPYPNLSADPLMTDQNASPYLYPRDARRKDLYGDNRDGFLHNDGHANQEATIPGYVASKPAKLKSRAKG